MFEKISKCYESPFVEVTALESEGTIMAGSIENIGRRHEDLEW